MYCPYRPLKELMEGKYCKKEPQHSFPNVMVHRAFTFKSHREYLCGELISALLPTHTISVSGIELRNLL
jgi:hypothetical protein